MNPVAAAQITAQNDWSTAKKTFCFDQSEAPKSLEIKHKAKKVGPIKFEITGITGESFCLKENDGASEEHKLPYELVLDDSRMKLLFSPREDGFAGIAVRIFANSRMMRNREVQARGDLKISEVESSTLEQPFQYGRVDHLEGLNRRENGAEIDEIVRETTGRDSRQFKGTLHKRMCSGARKKDWR